MNMAPGASSKSGVSSEFGVMRSRKTVLHDGGGWTRKSTHQMTILTQFMTLYTKLSILNLAQVTQGSQYVGHHVPSHETCGEY